MLAFAVAVAASMRLLLGVDPQALLHATLAGQPPLIVWLAGLFVLFGLWQLVIGLRAALTHNDPVNRLSLLASVALMSGIVIYGPGLGAGLSPVAYGWARALAVALLADSAVNSWLQLRSLFRRRRPAFDPGPSTSLLWMQRTRVSIERETLYVMRRQGGVPPAPSLPHRAVLPAAGFPALDPPRVSQLDHEPVPLLPDASRAPVPRWPAPVLRPRGR